MTVFRAMVYVRDFMKRHAGELTPTAREMAWCLAAHTDTDGSSCPSVETLARMTDSDRSTIKRARVQLVRAGLVTVELKAGRGNANVYRFPFDRAGAGAPLALLKGGADAPISVIHKGGADAPISAAELSGKGALPPVKGRTTVPEKGAPVRPEVVREVVREVAPADSVDAAWPVCVHRGCDVRIDPWEHKARCPAHTAVGRRA